MMLFRRKKSIPVHDISPDEIFLDARNIPQFDTNQFEGKIEKPIARRELFLFGLFLTCVGVLIVGRVFFLQIMSGEQYASLAESNRLNHTLIFSQRGPIYDRNGLVLAWNESQEATSSTATTSDTDSETFSLRKYDPHLALSHIVGYVRYPKMDPNGYYIQNAITGVEGVEEMYDSLLAGEQGRKIVEQDALGKRIAGSTITKPKDGEPLRLTIDSRIQKELYEYAQDLMDEKGFTGGAGIIMDVTTGEIIALVSIPGFDPNILSSGSDVQAIAAYSADTQNPFLNRAIGGRYTPGSIIKPFIAIGALAEKVITPEKQIFSDGSLRVPNPYNPDKPTVFKDWKAHGWVDMRQAIAVSSNVYFMTIGGGFGDQKGLGIENIGTYTRLFGIGTKTGIDISGEVDGLIPSIAWKQEHFPDDPWRVGDTYNTSIGQYGFQVTPLQMVRGIAAIANDGLLVVPHLRSDAGISPVDTIPIDSDVLAVVREGMRRGATEGTAKALNVAYTEFAGKTGTAELGVSKERVNSWIEGFWPYESPRYAFVMVMEHGPVTNLVGSASVMRRLFDWMHTNTPEYFDAEQRGL
ncbi:MAG: penicillin-binding transpeptidase domain-containing protein [Candidatus Campbellbacteria bacterium]|nr:penicillin-binding transpeptidase domain-containing protein [Candidatus Campbellbacteria bacterium]